MVVHNTCLGEYSIRWARTQFSLRLRNFVPLSTRSRINAIHAGRQCKYGWCFVGDEVVYSICQGFGTLRSYSCRWVKLPLEILRAYRPGVEPCANHTAGLGSEIYTSVVVLGENWIKVILRGSIFEYCTANDDRECIGDSTRKTVIQFSTNRDFCKI